jgi:hypothetical protein
MVRLPTRQRRRRLLGRSREAMAKPGGDDRRDLRVRVLLHLLVLGHRFCGGAPIEGLAFVRHSNGTCSFPAFRFMNGFARSGEKGSVRQGWPHPQLPRRGPVLCVVHSNCSDAAGRCPSGLSCGRSCSSHLLPPAHRLETTKKIDGRVRRGVFRNQRNHSLGRLDRVFTEYRRVRIA